LFIVLGLFDLIALNKSDKGLSLLRRVTASFTPGHCGVRISVLQCNPVARNGMLYRTPHDDALAFR
jgi:hypothetical protein